MQNEDCMNLNVWTQSLDAEAKKPVIVFFHGGGFTNGSSVESAAYDGKNLSEYADSANLGVQDLVASLQWIQDNMSEKRYDNQSKLA